MKSGSHDRLINDDSNAVHPLSKGLLTMKMVPFAEPASPGTVSARQFFTNPSSKEGVGGFTQGVAPSLGRTPTSSLTSNDQASGFSSRSTFAHHPTSSGGADSFSTPKPSYPFATRSAFETAPAVSERAGSAALSSKAESEGFAQLQQPPQQYPISTQASQGSVDTNAGGGAPAASSGFSSGLPAALSPEGSYQATASAQDLPESAAELVQGSGHLSSGPNGTEQAPSSVAVDTVPLDATLSSLPPSASWGAAPSPAVPAEPALPAVYSSDGYQAQGTQSEAFSSHDNQQTSFPPLTGSTSSSLIDHASSYNTSHDHHVGAMSSAGAGLTDVPSFGEGISELPSQPHGSSDLPLAYSEGQLPAGTEAQFQPLRQGATQLPSRNEEEQFQPLTQGASQLSIGHEDQFQQGSSVLPLGSTGSGFSQDEQLLSGDDGQVPLGSEGQFPQQGRAGVGSYEGAHRPLHRQLSAQAESLLRQSSTMTGDSLCVTTVLTCLLHISLWCKHICCHVRPAD